MQTVRVERAIMAALSPLTGVVSSGTVTATATGANIVLPKYTHGYPVINGQLMAEAIVKTTAEATVTNAGVSVPIKSVLGGAMMNLAEDVVIRWDPVVTGLAPTASVNATMTGGAYTDIVGSVKRIVSFEKISGTVASEIFNAQIGQFPAIVLSWDGSDGGRLVGRGDILRSDSWSATIIVGRLDSDEARRNDGRNIADAVEGRLVDVASVGDQNLSNPPITIRNKQRVDTRGSSYIFVVEFDTHITVTRTDYDTFGHAFNDWVNTMYTLNTFAKVDDESLPIVNEAKFEMPT